MPADPLSWLFGLEQFGMKLGLHNIHALLDALGRPERAYRTVHVAGTNGKGSVTAMVAAALLAAGHRSARYTSPHLVDVTERVVVAGRPVDRDTLAAVVADLRRLVDDLIERGVLAGPPTFFEVTTAAAFEVFRRAGVDVAVCEVGLGGRLDATNEVAPVVTAITSIGLDHEQHLGTTLREIAVEKAGIIKPGVPVVLGPMPLEALDVITGIARARGAPVISALADGSVETAGSRSTRRLPRIVVRTPVREYGPLVLGLRGAHQVANAVVATRMLEAVDTQALRVPAAAIIDGLTGVEWPGRLEHRLLADGREMLLDAAHNPDGAAALAAYLATDGAGRRPIVFAAMGDKDTAGMLRHLAPASTAFVMTRASPARSADPAMLADIVRSVAPGTPVTIESDVGDALAAAWRLSPRIVVAGSIFLLGDVMRRAERS
jgi:dihydrofolate synthase/folylpolyglutamate synthase